MTIPKPSPNDSLNDFIIISLFAKNLNNINGKRHQMKDMLINNVETTIKRGFNGGLTQLGCLDD